MLVTNALQHLPIADHVIVMDHGRIVEQGGYAQLMAAGLDFASLVSTHTMTDDADDELGTAPAQGGPPTRASGGSRKSMEAGGRKCVCVCVARLSSGRECDSLAPCRGHALTSTAPRRRVCWS